MHCGISTPPVRWVLSIAGCIKPQMFAFALLYCRRIGDCTMEHCALLSAALLLLAGCMTFPTTPQETRSMTHGQTAKVSRSASSVTSTLESQGRACLNFGATTTITRIGGSPGQGMNAVFQDGYRTLVNGRTLVIEHNSPNNLGAAGWYPPVVAEVTSVSGGSIVTVYALRVMESPYAPFTLGPAATRGHAHGLTSYNDRGHRAGAVAFSGQLNNRGDYRNPEQITWHTSLVKPPLIWRVIARRAKNLTLAHGGPAR